jgi:uncharacterized protein (DUF1684 family)
MSDREVLSLLDWRRRVTGLYAEVRALRGKDPEAAHAHWRLERDRLFAAHPQSPLHEERRGDFRGLPVHPYDPSLAFSAHIDMLGDGERTSFPTPDGGRFLRLGTVDLPLGRLDVYWLDTYGGGLFLPFRDATAGTETYGGGRYVLDTPKGADLGETSEGALVIDFNFAYHPSCAYSPVWTCPLAPPENRLDVPVRAGEVLLPEEAPPG